MTECNQCGACCNPVLSVVSPYFLDTGKADEVIGPDEAHWMRSHLTPIKPRRVGLERVRDWNSGQSEFRLAGHMFLMLTWFYECDLFDADTNECSDWANRPNMCRGYPWYDDGPDPRKSLPPTCSYRADIGKAVEIRSKPCE